MTGGNAPGGAAAGRGGAGAGAWTGRSRGGSGATGLAGGAWAGGDGAAGGNALARGGPFSLGEAAPQVVNRPPLLVEFLLEGSQPPGEPDLPEQGDNREHGDGQADQREKQRQSRTFDGGLGWSSAYVSADSEIRRVRAGL